MNDDGRIPRASANVRDRYFSSVQRESEEARLSPLDNNLTRQTTNNPLGPTAPGVSSNVLLNVYDLDSLSARFNRYARRWNTGAFHAGVEVYGIEYSFGQTSTVTPGITINKPRCHPVHIYRESVQLGNTLLNPQQVKDLIECIKPDWSGDTYSLIRKNCINFAAEFSTMLGVGSIPDWVSSLQDSAIRASYHIDTGVSTLQEANLRFGFTESLRKMGDYVWERGGFIEEVSKAVNIGWSTISTGVAQLQRGVSDVCVDGAKESDFVESYIEQHDWKDDTLDNTTTTTNNKSCRDEGNQLN